MEAGLDLGEVDGGVTGAAAIGAGAGFAAAM